MVEDIHFSVDVSVYLVILKRDYKLVLHKMVMVNLVNLFIMKNFQDEVEEIKVTLIMQTSLTFDDVAHEKTVRELVIVSVSYILPKELQNREVVLVV